MSAVDEIRRKRLQDLQDEERTYKQNFVLDNENIIRVLEAIRDSPPTVTDENHPDHWWNTTFGKLIKQEWTLRVEQAISHVKRMKMPL